MKRLLMATAAVIALAVAAPIATAQYTTPPPATAPYTTPVPDDPMTPQDESLSNQQDATTSQSQSTLATPGAPETTDPMPSTTAQTQTDLDTQMGATAQAETGTTAQAQTGVDTTTQGWDGAQSSTQAQAGVDQSQTMGSTSTYGSTSADSYAQASESSTTMASLEQHAIDAGMDRLPMTPQEVCMPREVSLTTSGTRLSRDKQHQLINAADRASVCEIQRVVINSPNGRADQARQLLVAHGVDASMIEVVDSDTGGLEVEMNFAGIATSSEQYAQMFSTQQYASYQPSSAAQGAQTYGSAPSYQPNTAPGTAPDQSMPAPSSSEGVWLGDPNVEVPDAPASDEMDDGMSPTSGEPVVRPDMLDI